MRTQTYFNQSFKGWVFFSLTQKERERGQVIAMFDIMFGLPLCSACLEILLLRYSAHTHIHTNWHVQSNEKLLKGLSAVILIKSLPLFLVSSPLNLNLYPYSYS